MRPFYDGHFSLYTTFLELSMHATQKMGETGLFHQK